MQAGAAAATKDRHCRRFGGAARSASAARRFVRNTLAGLPKDLVADVELMVSELASNCVVHARTGFEVCLLRAPGTLRVEVTDEGLGDPRIHSPAHDGRKGRGLMIVDALSDTWGVEHRPDGEGKTVWFAVRHLPSGAVPVH